MGLVVGIDLGTTNTAIAILKNGEPVIIENEMGERITPSVVNILDNGEINVGNIARRNASIYPDRTVIEVKSLMGKDEKIKVGNKEFLPQEISAYILKYIKDSVEMRLGEEIEEAIITVPASFNDLQRKATKDAGEIAGLKVERIINEPTAAALAYGIENFGNKETILVYDLGGGTFDVTVLELDDGIFAIKSSEGDSALGGSNFDELLSELAIDNLKKENKLDLNSDSLPFYPIKYTSEEIKKELSFRENANFNIPFLRDLADEEGNPIRMDMRISRKEFEKLIKIHIDRTNEILDLAMKNANTSIDEIDTVLAIGGSTRIPVVKKLLKDKFGNRVKYNINPDEAVALGAAIQGGIKSKVFEANHDFIITDVAPHTLGISVVKHIGGVDIDGAFDSLILKNSTIPRTERKSYTTLYDNQTVAGIKVYQGEELLAEKNHFIGSFGVKNIPGGPAGSQNIEVEFNYNINGMLEVNAYIVSTKEKTTKMFGGVGMSESRKMEVEQSINKDWEKSKLSSKVATIIETAERKIDELDEEGQYQLRLIIKEMKMAVLNDNESLVNELDEKLTGFLFNLMDI